VEIDATTTRVKRAGNIGHPELSLFTPSIAVNELGQVVIGFSGSSSKQYPSAFYAIGNTVEGHTEFSPPRLLQAGNGSFHERWGDYSTTVVDPYDPLLFWTFQEYTVARDQWGVKIGAIRTGAPDGGGFVRQHNQIKAQDVSGDGHVAADDVLMIINTLNAFGSGTVPPDSVGGPYCDVNNDGIVAPDDALNIINYINAKPSREGESSEPLVNASEPTVISTALLRNSGFLTDTDLIDLLASEVPQHSRRRQ
jgi:hypothetical protein